MKFILIDYLFQIKNAVRAAYTLTVNKRSWLCYFHLKTVFNSSKEFKADFKKANQIDNLKSYM